MRPVMDYRNKKTISIGLAISGVKGLVLLKHALRNSYVDVKTVFSYYGNNAFFEEIKKTCKNHKIEFIEEKHIERFSDELKSKKLLFLFVAGWGFKIPKTLFNIPLQGIIVFHDSLLPKYRGFAPTFWTLINGGRETGVTVFFIATEIDSGDIIFQQKIRILDKDNINSLIDKVTNAYKNIFNKIISYAKERKPLPRKKQNDKNATYCIWRTTEDAKLIWTESACAIMNLLRASKPPYYSAFTFYSGKKLFVTDAEISNYRKYVGNIPGKVENIKKGDGVFVLTGRGIIKLKKVQVEGEEERNAWDVIKSIYTVLR